MSSIKISPVQWSNFQYIDDIKPINDSDSDFECLNEVRDVLKKYNRLKGFGVALLHTHFNVNNDKIMLETANNKNRRLVIEPTKTKNVGSNNVGTIWTLQDGDNIEAMSWCRQYCQTNLFHGHSDKHNKES